MDCLTGIYYRDYLHCREPEGNPRTFAVDRPVYNTWKLTIYQHRLSHLWIDGILCTLYSMHKGNVTDKGIRKRPWSWDGNH
jgi:hypothetical protein